MQLYETLIANLKALKIPLAEYAWDVRPDTDYLVIAIDTEAASLQADGAKVNQSPQGTVDLFTSTNDRTVMQSVQGVLDALDGCAWYLNSVQYEDDTRLLHWEWVFSLETW
jgi:hypothetical protein